MRLSLSLDHLPAEMVLQSQRETHHEFNPPAFFWTSPAPQLDFLWPSKLTLGSGDVSQTSSSSVFRNGRVGATDTHQYPAPYYFLPALAPLQA